MPFMLLTLAVVIVIAVVAFFGTNPHVPNPRALLHFNVAVLVLSLPVGIAVGFWLYGDAMAARPNGKGMAIYLGIMAGGTASLFVVAIGGLLRNFFVFPRGKRLPAPPAQAH